MVFSIELPAAGFGVLREKLSRLGVILEVASSEELALSAGPPGDEIMASLRVDFQHEEPDLRIQLPAVPG